MATILWSLPVASNTSRIADVRPPVSHVPGRPLVDDPIDFLLDVDGDIAIVDGDFVASTGIVAVAQNIRIALLIFRGEWFLDLDVGVPYFQSILGTKFDASALGNAFRDEMRKVDDVIEILSLQVEWDPTTRHASVSWQVRTTFGDTDPDSINSEINQ